MNKESKLIGHYTLKEPKIMTKLFQYAAYYQNIEVPAGVYPVVCYTFEERTINGIKRTCVGWQNYIDFEGEVLNEYFGNVSYSDVGETVRYGRHIYGYELCDELFKTDPAFKLTDDYELVNFTEVRDGELSHISRIALIETKEKEKEILPLIEKTREKEDSHVQEDKDYETQQREL